MAYLACCSDLLGDKQKDRICMLKNRMNRHKGWMEYMSGLTLTELSWAFLCVSLWNKKWVPTVQGETPIKWNFIKRTGIISFLLPAIEHVWIYLNKNKRGEFGYCSRGTHWRFIRSYFNIWFTVYVKPNIPQFLFLMLAFCKWILVLELFGWLLFMMSLQIYSMRGFPPPPIFSVYLQKE